MTTKILISAFLVLTVASCSNKRTHDNPKDETPKALEDKSSSFEIISKRSFEDDIVESLYDELVNKDTSLKKLEERIEDLNKSKDDTIELFDKFNAKNQSYFSSADKHLLDIKDSILGEKIKDIVSTQLTKYNSRVSRNNELLNNIDTKQTAIIDLHNALKILRTLSLIDKYQKSNLPNTKALEGYIKQQEETIRLADTLLKK